MIEKVTIYSRHNKIHHGGALIVFKPTDIPGINMAEVTIAVATTLEQVPGCAHRSLRALDGLAELPSVESEPESITPPAEVVDAPKPKGRPGPKPKAKPEVVADGETEAQSESTDPPKDQE